MSLTAAERSARARMGAYAQQAQHDTREMTQKARETFLSRFEREVDPDGVLLPAERARRAEAARKAYFAGLTLTRLRSRGRKKQNAEPAHPASAAMGGASRASDQQLQSS
jgi:hypothetical protein